MDGGRHRSIVPHGHSKAVAEAGNHYVLHHEEITMRGLGAHVKAEKNRIQFMKE
jgi:hypothetical protein